MQIVIDVTAEEEASIRAKARAAGYGTSSDYLMSLIAADESAVADDYDPDADEGPPSQRGRTDAELEQLLVERLESGDFVPVTDQMFDDIRERVRILADQRRGE